MTDGITIHGADGELFWGYSSVGTVRAWTVTRHTPSDPGTLSGTVEHLNAFRASQHPITFVVQHKQGAWRWPLETLQIAGTSLTARLRPLERSDT